jgi:hypothetical protein
VVHNEQINAELTSDALGEEGTMGESSLAPAPAGTWKARWKEETRVMMHIALPIVLSNLLAVAMQMTDLAFVGRRSWARRRSATPSSTCCTTPCSA